MKKLLALILAVLTLTAALCGCGDTAAPGTSDNDAPVSTPDAGETGDTGNSGNAVVTTSLPTTTAPSGPPSKISLYGKRNDTLPRVISFL